MRKGVNLNGDPGRCMVVGCGKKAIYQSRMAKYIRSPRGYCSDHRHLASEANGTVAPRTSADYLAERYGDK